MPADKRKPIDTLALLLLLVFALAMRLQQWNRIAVPDEAALLNMTFHLYDNPFPNGTYPGYPGFPPFFLYLNFLISFVCQKLLLFFGVIQFPSQFVYSNQGFDFVLKAGRIISALTGTALVALSWRLGREFFNRTTAWAAALLMAVNSLLVFDSHIFKPDTMMALLLCASLYYALQHDREAHWRWLFFSSLFFGLAVAAKYNAAVELFFLLPVFLITCRRNRQPLWKPLFMAPAAMALGFFAGAPNWIVHPFLNLAEAYRFVTYHYSSFHFYNDKKLAYSAFSKTFLESFGPILCAFLLIGLLAIIFNRRRTDMIIAAYIIVYVAILGNTSYFGVRMVLPLLPAAALLIASGMFDALPRLLRKFKNLAAAYRFVAWALLAIFAASGALQNIRRFNLLGTASTYDQAIDYRFRHIPFGYTLARENLTPGFSGDMGFSDLTSVPRQWFKGPNAMRFLCTGLFTHYILEETGNSPIKHKLKRYLTYYTPIERIHKPRFSSFDDDITFWYKKPSWVKDLNLDRPLPHLPSVFSLPPSELASDTCYLPLQNFEKSALAGKIARDIWTKKIYSTRPFSRIVFYILPNGVSKQLFVTVNGEKEKFPLGQVRRIRRIVFDRIRPQFLHDDYIYSVEMATDATRLPIFLVCMPEFASAPDPAPEAALFDRPQIDPLPDLFSASEAPCWCREVYRIAGIDPILHRFIQTERLFSNFEQSNQDRVLDDFPLVAGGYLLRIKGKKIVATQPLTANLKLTWHAIGLNKEDNGEFNFSPAEMASGIVRPIAVDELAFVQFGIEGQCPSNFLIDELSIEPDYLTYINTYWLKK
ncbi:MAG: glycosyltransferase family 39 protein [Candidatus Aminicenantes bacterium]|nr:glycosyltransferase family 39 protein [Candidatus Aminicenantes bacterium]